jgi:hypothetical protein
MTLTCEGELFGERVMDCIPPGGWARLGGVLGRPPGISAFAIGLPLPGAPATAVLGAVVGEAEGVGEGVVVVVELAAGVSDFGEQPDQISGQSRTAVVRPMWEAEMFFMVSGIV